MSTATTLTIAAGSTTSAGTVTVTGVDNNVDADNKQVTVSATRPAATGWRPAATLTVADDEATATATVVLTPAAILENEEVSTVTARLSHPTAAAVTLTVATRRVRERGVGDFTVMRGDHADDRGERDDEHRLGDDHLGEQQRWLRGASR